MGSIRNVVGIAVVLLGVASIGTFVGSPDTRDAADDPAPVAASEAPQPEPAPQQRMTPPAADDRTLTPATVQRLVRDVADADAGTRANALDALAAAPPGDAVPVLLKVLGGGDDIERQLALSSLHVLAMRYGDDSGAIREMLRQSIYDGGDEAVTSGAQVALEDIERKFGQHAAMAGTAGSDR